VKVLFAATSLLVFQNSQISLPPLRIQLIKTKPAQPALIFCSLRNLFWVWEAVLQPKEQLEQKPADFLPALGVKEQDRIKVGLRNYQLSYIKILISLLL
jgi:hypothetical protein